MKFIVHTVLRQWLNYQSGRVLISSHSVKSLHFHIESVAIDCSSVITEKQVFSGAAGSKTNIYKAIHSVMYGVHLLCQIISQWCHISKACIN